MSDVTGHDDGERDDDVVAAEYVLGVLPAADRADVARRVDTDRAFAMRVAAWEERLSGMNEAFGETAPPADAWRKVEDRLFRFDPTQKVPNAGLWTSLVFWRALAIAAFAMVAILAGTMVMREDPRLTPGAELVASLSAADSDAAFVAVRRNDGSLSIATVGAPPPEGRDHELWVIAGEDAPVSLGLLAADDAVTAVLPDEIAALDPSQLTLAVSVEPQGGSPTGAPTGPVVAAGKLTRI